MTPIGKGRFAAAVLLSAVLVAGGAAPAAEPTGKRLPPHVAVEEMEVRGVREEPGRLYVPVPVPIVLTAPVRYDFVLEDMARPIPLGEALGVPAASEGDRDDGDDLE